MTFIILELKLSTRSLTEIQARAGTIWKRKPDYYNDDVFVCVFIKMAKIYTCRKFDLQCLSWLILLFNWLQYLHFFQESHGC